MVARQRGRLGTLVVGLLMTRDPDKSSGGRPRFGRDGNLSREASASSREIDVELPKVIPSVKVGRSQTSIGVGCGEL